MSDSIVVRGAESEVAAFRNELEAHLQEIEFPADEVEVGAPARVQRKLTDPAPLGHELLVQIAIEIGKAVAIGVASGVIKDLLVDWIKQKAKKRGLKVEVKGAEDAS